MTADLTLPLVPELALFALSVLVLVAGLMRHPSSAVASGGGKLFGWITLVGLLVVIGLTFTTQENSSLFNGAFVQDGLALFAKRLVLAAAALSVLGSLTNKQATFTRRAILITGSIPATAARSRRRFGPSSRNCSRPTRRTSMPATPTSTSGSASPSSAGTRRWRRSRARSW